LQCCGCEGRRHDHGGRGAAIHETKTLLGTPIEPERETVLTAIPVEKTETVLAAIVQSADHEVPGA